MVFTVGTFKQYIARATNNYSLVLVFVIPPLPITAIEAMRFLFTTVFRASIQMIFANQIFI